MYLITFPFYQSCHSLSNLSQAPNSVFIMTFFGIQDLLCHLWESSNSLSNPQSYLKCSFLSTKTIKMFKYVILLSLLCFDINTNSHLLQNITKGFNMVFTVPLFNSWDATETYLLLRSVNVKLWAERPLSAVLGIITSITQSLLSFLFIFPSNTKNISSISHCMSLEFITLSHSIVTSLIHCSALFAHDQPGFFTSCCITQTQTHSESIFT